MYLRTTTRKNKDGTEVCYYQLAQNYRCAETKTVQAKVIHNFGRADQLDRKELVRLCQSIAKVCGLQVYDPLEHKEDSEKFSDPPLLPPDVKLIKTYQLGTVWVIESVWEWLEIGAELRKISKTKGLKIPYERALLAMVANRLSEPESKLGVWEKWLAKVYLPSCQDLKLPQLYEAMDLLYEHIAQLEESIFFKTADLMSLEVDVVFYDTTTCTFAIDDEDDEEKGIRILGRPKEGGWTPQIIVALAVTKDGVPVKSWVFPGNMSDVATVEQVKKDLRGWKLGRALFVADSGMNSQENREELAKACGRYILATRVGSIKEVQQEVLSRPGRYRQVQENLQAKEVLVGEGEKRRRYIVCHNDKQAQRESAHRQQVLEELEAELARHPGQDATAKWAIELRSSGRYGRYVKENSKKQLIINKEAVKKAERMDGKWVLITNDDTLTLEDAALGYKNLLVIEHCFRVMKRTQLKMSPVYHWLPKRIESHIKICVLALLIERIVELKLKQPWSRIKEVLEQLQVSEFRTNSHLFFYRNEVPSPVASILKKLTISVPKQVLALQELPQKL